jgi:hypothetical protein
MPTQLDLHALSPSNPCAYLAGLGLLRIVTERHLLDEPHLKWLVTPATQHAVLHTATDITLEELCELLARTHDDSWLPDTGKDIRKITPDKWHEVGGPTWAGRPDHLDKNGELLTSQWRTFAVKERVGWLEAVTTSAKIMTDPAKWLEALSGPWLQSDPVSPLGFDPDSFQDGATQASDASTVKPHGTAGAVWLAVNALPLFPMIPGARRPFTSGIRNDRFVYVTWADPLPLSTVKALCRAPWHRVGTDQFEPYGVNAIWSSELTRTATGRRQLSLAHPT